MSLSAIEWNILCLVNFAMCNNDTVKILCKAFNEKAMKSETFYKQLLLLCYLDSPILISFQVIFIRYILLSDTEIV